MKKTLIALAMVMTSGSVLASTPFPTGIHSATIKTDIADNTSILDVEDTTLVLEAKYEAPKSCFVISTVASESFQMGTVATDHTVITLAGNKATATLTLNDSEGDNVEFGFKNYVSGTPTDINNDTNVDFTVTANSADTFSPHTDYVGTATITIDCNTAI